MKLWLPSLPLIIASACGQTPFINELHYDNAGADTGEGIEIAAAAGLDLMGYRLDFYNGNGGALYKSERLDGVIPNLTDNGFGVLWFEIAGIQNGHPDAVALVGPDGEVIEAISYEGTQVISGNAAQDIGVEESNNTPVGFSLGLIGSGREAKDFLWAADLIASPGALNPGQAAAGDTIARTILTSDSLQIEEGEGITFTISLQPPPESVVTIGLAADPSGRIELPESVVVGTSGEAMFSASTNTDGVPAGAVGIIVSGVPDGAYPAASTAVILADAEAIPLRETSFRLATLNVENGTGAPRSRSFEGVVSLLRRIDADVIGFQEVEDGFSELAAAGAAAGYPHIAFGDDRFPMPSEYQSGEFGSGQNLAVLSRFPIIETLQIGRADGAIREHTRFPLFVRIDAPNDPVIVVAHYKASDDDSSSFRRAVEAFRTVEFLRARGLDGSSDNIFVIGDLNEDVEDFQPQSFDSSLGSGSGMFPDGSTLPGSFSIGSDLIGMGSRELIYGAFPRAVFAALAIREQGAFQVDGIDRTRAKDSPRRLDYILVPDRVLTAGNAPQEVFNSLLETRSPGLPKAGLPLGATTSRDAADHQIVFGDFELFPRPTLVVTVSPDSVDEGGESALTIRISPSEEPVTVTIGAAPFIEAAPESYALNFAAGETTKMVSIRTFADSLPAPDQGIVFAATAPGYSTGYATLDVRNLQPAGDILFTQVSEQAGNGSNRLAIEIANLSERRFNFFETPLSLRSYEAGGRNFTRPVQIEDGFLDPGGVVVIGEGFAGDSIIASPRPVFSSAFDNTPYFDSSGQLRFVFTRQVVFNGDEAQEILLGQTRQDVFGQIGEDPGVGWSANGVSTWNQNIERLGYATDGSSGWSDPSFRFTRILSSNPLEGIGEIPDFDPYLDSDGDGFSDFLEFAAGTSAADPNESPEITSEIDLREIRFTHPERINSGVVWSIEKSLDLKAWIPDGEATVTHIEGRAIRTSAVEQALAPIFYRLRATLAE